MPEMKRKKTLEIDENLAYQESFWKIQRIGWLVMAGVLLLAVFGLLGGEGIMNSRRAGDRQLGIEANYQPFLHRDAAAEMTLRLYPETDDTARVFISDDYLDKVQIKAIAPQPRTVTTVEGGHLYAFDADTDETSASFYLWPDNTTVGAIRGRIGSDPDRTVAISQWVYP